jgi:hypothetical protein
MISKDKGYNRVFKTKFGLRKYKRKSSFRQYERTGKFRNVGTGSGHKAGEEWGDRKNIDSHSRQTRYSKNSPSFDEGVFLSKARRKALEKLRE